MKKLSTCLLTGTGLLLMMTSMHASVLVTSPTHQPYLGITAAAPYITFEIGRARVASGNKQVVDVGSGFTKQFLPTKEDTSTLYNIGLGYAWTVHDRHHWRLGVMFSRQSSALSNGKVYDYSDSTMYNYDYQYHFKSVSGFANLQYGYSFAKYWVPYLRVGAGVSKNEVSGFLESARDSGNSNIVGRFGDANKTRFAYSVGAGLSWPLGKTCDMHVGYTHQALGKVAFKASTTSVGAYTTKAVTRNGVLAGLSVRF